MDRATTNGGFPLPHSGQPVRELATHHDACDGETRMRLPRAVPPRAVRRVVCDRCAQAYAPGHVAEVGAEPAAPAIPSSRVRWLGLPVAAAAVLGALYLVQGGDEGKTPEAPAPAREARTAAPTAEAPADARLVNGSTFQLALPSGWKRTTPSGGATFAAAAPGGEADVMLWIERDRKLDFATFEARSLSQLESLAGSAGVVRRNPGPTPAQTTSLLAPTSAPDEAPNFEVLISGGPGSHWYYLATTTQPGAGSDAGDGVKLIQGSFLPRGAGR